MIVNATAQLSYPTTPGPTADTPLPKLLFVDFADDFEAGHTLLWSSEVL